MWFSTLPLSSCYHCHCTQWSPQKDWIKIRALVAELFHLKERGQKRTYTYTHLILKQLPYGCGLKKTCVTFLGGWGVAEKKPTLYIHPVLYLCTDVVSLFCCLHPHPTTILYTLLLYPTTTHTTTTILPCTTLLPPRTSSYCYIFGSLHYYHHFWDTAYTHTLLWPYYHPTTSYYPKKYQNWLDFGPPGGEVLYSHLLLPLLPLCTYMYMPKNPSYEKNLPRSL